MGHYYWAKYADTDLLAGRRKLQKGHADWFCTPEVSSAQPVQTSPPGAAGAAMSMVPVALPQSVLTAAGAQFRRRHHDRVIRGQAME